MPPGPTSQGGVRDYAVVTAPGNSRLVALSLLSPPLVSRVSSPGEIDLYRATISHRIFRAQSTNCNGT